MILDIDSSKGCSLIRMIESETPLPDNFWEGGSYKIKEDYKDRPDFRIINFSPRAKRFRVKTERDNSENYTRYHTFVTDEIMTELASKVDLHFPGYLVKASTTTRFEEAIESHFKALAKLEKLGY